MKSLEIRKKFFDFFISKGHEKVPSSPLIPAQDPTLLFANAGMNQFKDLFLGKEKRSYTRAVSIQKCIRAGGKHNDLDNVGFTKKHLTFFEMMGNFSFGDYFKKEAIPFGWNFLTQDMGMDKNNLVVSVYLNDDESYEIWHKDIGVPKDRIYRLGASENFWQMGDTGPCGPCTEIHVDRGVAKGCGKKNCDPSCDCERFIEVWNIVFMQFDRQTDGTDKLLKQTGVDTGMGLERLCTIVQGVDSVYDTDLFIPIIKKIEELVGISYNKADTQTVAAFHVIADHLRSSVFAISDGVSPSNEGRGYVLRKIIRRAALFEKQLSNTSFFTKLIPTLVDMMSGIYPELKTNQALVTSVIESEIKQFAANLSRGYPILEETIASCADTKVISGTDAFRLYDTFGFPVELVIARAREKGFSVDMAGFEAEMEKQRAQSGKKVKEEVTIELPSSITTEFVGYPEQENFSLTVTSPIIALIHNNNVVDKVKAGQECWVITKQSPFFVECGGQVDDNGWIEVNGKRVEISALKNINGAIAVHITAPVDLKTGLEVTSIVDRDVRDNIMKNHTATHLLQAALVNQLGSHVKQSGSIVTPNYLRFDFTYHQNLTPEQVTSIEQEVNQLIMANLPVAIYETNLKDAVKKGVKAIFGEKYNPEKVRVIDVPGFSAELCGGTHVLDTGDIGPFKITEVSALSAGNRRIVAVTGPQAVKLMQENFNIVKTLCQEFKVQSHEILDAISKQKEQIKALQIQLRQFKKQNLSAQIPLWADSVTTHNNIPFLFLLLEEYGNDELKQIAQQLMDKKPGFYFIASTVGDRTIFVATVDKKHAHQVDLKAFGNWLKSHQLRGGGSQTLIQGGGPAISESFGIEIASWLTKSK